MNKELVNHLYITKGFYWLLPDTSLYSAFDLSRLKIINSIHILFFFFALFMVYADFYLIPDNEVPTFLPIAAVVTLQYVFKRFGNLLLSSNLTCFFLFLTVAPSIASSGGLYSDNLVWLIMVPVLAFFLTDRTSGLLWLGVLLSTLFYFYTLEVNATESFRNLTLQYTPSYFLLSWAFLFLLVSLIAFLFSKGKDQLIQTLFKSQSKLLEQQEKIIQQAEDAKENEQKVKKLNQKLEQFAYTISHDLKEPLRSIKMYTSLLEKNLDHCLSETDREYMGCVQNGTDRMHNLLVDLLEYSKIDDEESVRRKVILDDVILIVKNQLNATIIESNAQLEVTNNLQGIMANHSLISMLFQNLINNAIKFRKPGQNPHIKISSEIDSNENLIIHIQDNGIGIPEEFQHKIFDIFTKFHTTSKFEGSGIGLSTCKKVIEGMNGKIWLNSKKGVGTTFHLLFPKESVLKVQLS
ncbi:MAG: signal transduction histidine kinase, partial [Patescibacteria group bacterium]